MSQNDMRPYLVRAVYEWAVDHHFTPYIEVDAEKDYVTLPGEYVQDGRITLNIAPQAVHNFCVDEMEMSFQTRFGGIVRQVKIPIFMIMRIYAYENGIGMSFREEKEDRKNYPLASNMRGRPKLRLVEKDEEKNNE